jgi:hypothetical protein
LPGNNAGFVEQSVFHVEQGEFIKEKKHGYRWDL